MTGQILACRVANYAAVDCGTLSTRLLVTGPGGEPLARLMQVTGLGQGVDRTGSLRPDAVTRALAVLEQYRRVMDHHDVAAARMVGTSALRDASNRASFSEPASAIIGAPLELLSGAEEAALSFLGASMGLPSDSGPWFMADIGGGSTELVVGPRPAGYCSLQLGCVRVTERFFEHDPPRPEELAEAAGWLSSRYAEAVQQEPALASGRAMVGLAGTVSALACFDQGLVTYDRDRVHHYRLSRPAVERALGQLAATPAEERAHRPGVEPARAPYIVGGTLVLATLMSHFGFGQCLVSESDILDGLTQELRSGRAVAGPRGATG